MPYTPDSDPYRIGAGFVSPAKSMSAVTAAPGDFAVYPKALRVFVAAGTAGPHLTVLPARNADGATVALTLSEGQTILDFVQVRAVTAITAGVTVHRLDD